MFSVVRRVKRRLLSFRLMAGYFLLFFVSTIALFGFSVLLLDRYVTNMERQRVAEKVDFYQSLQSDSGFAALVAELRREHKANRLSNVYIHLTDGDGKTIWLTVPEEFDTLPSIHFSTPFNGTLNNWQVVDLPIQNDLDVFSHGLPGGQVLHVGRTTERQEYLVESMRDMFLVVLLGIVLFGVVGGVVLAYQVLRPVRELTKTVKEVSSGDMTSRVPVHDPKGELDELAELVNVMLQQIETLIVAMRDALDNVGHDLRTPLARMKARVEQAIIEDASPQKQRETLMDCAEDIERINKLITMLMDIAEAETGQMRLNMDTFSAGELLDEIVELYDLIAEERVITLSVDAEEVMIVADRQRMAQAIGNLTDNALKYTPEDGAVTLTASATRDKIVLAVQDTGPGIPPEERERVFNKLYRLDKSRSTKGLGLGLSLVRAVVAAHGGTVMVVDTPGGGSRFEIMLPSQ
ncbi:MAG: HAMP domain-containing histidine kinase [Pseudodesulfovibrio sp.]